jgi:hypothetical protein
MSIATSFTDIHHLQEIFAQVERGEHDRVAALKEIAVMEKELEELRLRIGVVDVAVETIREVRDQSSTFSIHPWPSNL